MRILRTKSVEQSIKDTQEPEHRLRKVPGSLDLVVFGIGVTIGTGIFVLTGMAAATKAGHGRARVMGYTGRMILAHVRV